MIKMKTLAFMTILMLALTGCGKEEQEPLRIYSFSGENEQFAVSNGIIDLNGTLYFELTTKDKYGTENVYQLQMALTEITKNDGN